MPTNWPGLVQILVRIALLGPVLIWLKASGIQGHVQPSLRHLSCQRQTYNYRLCVVGYLVQCRTNDIKYIFANPDGYDIDTLHPFQAPQCPLFQARWVWFICGIEAPF